MPRPVRDRLGITYGFWAVAFVATLAVCGWKFGWLPVELSPPETGSVASPDAPPMPDLPIPPAAASSTLAPVEAPWAAQPARSVEPRRDRLPIAAAQPFPESAGATNPFGGEPEPESLSSEARTAARRIAPSPPAQASFDDDPEMPDVTIIRPDRARRTARDERTGMPATSPSRASPLGAPFDDESNPAPASRGIQLTGGEVPVEPARPPIASDDPRIIEVDRLLADGERLPAHKEMSKLYWKEADLRPILQERIDANAKVIYFSPQPHFMDAYVVQPGDQLSMIARHYSVPWAYLARLNRVDPKRIRPGQRLKVIKGPFAALVDLSDFELIVHAHGYYVKRYRIGIGRDDSTPIGKFTVKEKLVNPEYSGDGVLIHRDDPANPLGERWIDLGDSYGIHGTIRPESIGKAESKGCIRLLNEDVEELFDLLDKGSEVVIRR